MRKVLKEFSKKVGVCKVSKSGLKRYVKAAPRLRAIAESRLSEHSPPAPAGMMLSWDVKLLPVALKVCEMLQTGNSVKYYLHSKFVVWLICSEVERGKFAFRYWIAR